MTDTTSTLPPVPTAGLSPADLAASAAMGLRPVGIAQGYYCAHLVDWTKYKARIVDGYDKDARQDPNQAFGFVALHREVDHQWVNAFDVAFGRLRDDVRKMGAHGVIGCHSSVTQANGGFEVEAHLYGTAVVLEGAEPLPDGRIWSTSLAGHRLARLVETGYVPLNLWFAHVTVVVGWGGLSTYEMGDGEAGRSLPPMRDALTLARRSNILGLLDSNSEAAVYGMRRSVREEEGEGFHHVICTSYGDLVREVRGAATPAYPASTLSLA